MVFTASNIAELLEGKIVGNPETIVKNVSKIEEGKPETLTFLANEHYTKYIYTTEASVVIVSKSIKIEKDVKPTLIIVDDAYQSIAVLLEMYESAKPKKVGIEEPVKISKTAELGDDIYVGSFSYISNNAKIGNNVIINPQVYIGENVKIGENTVLNSGVRIYDNCVVGANCTIHSNTVIGADGFGFAPQGEDYKKVPQIGNVIIEDNVEIGANTCIDRATMGSTIIRKGVKLDNQIQIAHNVEIGANTVISAQTGIAGSTKVGKNCMFAGQVGIAPHLKVGDGVKIAAKTGVSNHIKNEDIVMGNPAYNIVDYRKSYIVFKKLPEIYKSITKLEKHLK